MSGKKWVVKVLFLLLGVFLLSSFLYSNSLDKEEISSLTENLAIIILNSNSIQLTNQARDYVIEQGGKIGLLFPPHVMIGWIPPELAAALIGQFGIEKISYNPLSPDEVTYKDHQTFAAVNFFNAFSSGTLRNEQAIAAEIKGEPLINDAFEQPPLNYKEYLTNLPVGVSPSPGNSDSMTGTVAVCLFFVESNGAIDENRYTWTPTDVSNTLNRASNGLLWWVNRASLEGYSLSFSVYYYPPTLSYMQQGYEPILHSSSDDYLWINAVMANLGYTTGTKFARVTAFNTWLRNYYGTNWSYSVFIAYNPSPAPDRFTDGYFAYAYMGGPYTQLLFRNNGWGEANFGLVLTHETGHIFWACDEYYQAGYGGCTSCGPCAPSGPRPYVPNANCEYCNPNSVPCMMRGNNDALCIYTKYQIGWLPLPSESSNTSSFTIAQGGVYTVTFAVSNSKTYTSAGYLSVSVSSGLEIVEVDGLAIDPYSRTSQTQSGVSYENYPVGFTIARCDSGTTVSSYQLVEIIASYNTSQSRSFNFKFRAKTGAGSSQWIKHRAAFVVPDNYFIRDPVSGSYIDQQNCYAKQIEVTVSTGVPITITTSPAGLQIIVDSSTYTAPQTFYWAAGSSHTLGVTSPQSGTTGTRYVFSSWSDGGAQTHKITTPSSATTYTAYFTTQYSLTTSANPVGGGTVNPSGTNWYNSGQSVQVQATASSGYIFAYWSGDLSGTQNPASITMNGPKVVTANFSLITPGGNKLRLLVRSSAGNEIYMNSLTSSGSWEGWTLLSGLTSDTPSAGVYNNLMHLVVKDAFNNNIWKNSWNATSWSGWTLLDGQTPAYVSLSEFGNKLYMAVVGEDNFIYLRYLDSSGVWSSWQRMNGTTTHTPAIAAFNNRLYMVVKSSTGNNLWWNSMDTAGNWSGWQLLDGATGEAPSLAVFNNRLYMAVKGTDNFIYYRYLDGSGVWSSWRRLNGTTTHSPAIVAFNNRLYLVVKSSTDTRLWLNSMDTAEVWGSWQPLDGWTSRAPAIVVY